MQSQQTSAPAAVLGPGRSDRHLHQATPPLHRHHLSWRTPIACSCPARPRDARCLAAPPVRQRHSAHRPALSTGRCAISRSISEMSWSSTRRRVVTPGSFGRLCVIPWFIGLHTMPCNGSLASIPHLSTGTRTAHTIGLHALHLENYLSYCSVAAGANACDVFRSRTGLSLHLVSCC